MRQRTKRLLSGLLAIILASGCAGYLPSDNVYAASANAFSSTLPDLDEVSLFSTTNDTGYDLVSEGSSVYRILIPSDATDNERFAAKELQHFVEEATNVKLPIQKEYEGINTEKILSVGDTKASQMQGVMPTYEEVLSNGFVLKTIEDSCYIKGYCDMGTRNGVYEWLRECFDYQCYAPDCVKVTEMQSRKLPSLNMIKKPDFEYRQGTGEVSLDATAAYRMQYNSNAELFVTDFSCHNSFDIIDPEGAYDYQSEAYQNWFSTALHKNEQRGQRELPAQLCYSNPDMRKEYVKNLKKVLNGSKDPVMLLGMEDNNLWCTCAACAASKEKYGTNSATIIQFANDVQDEINTWCDAQKRDRIQLVILAYHQCEEPPVKLDSVTNQYVPFDDSVKLHEDLGIMYAPVYASYVYSFEDEINSAYKEQIDGWSAVTDNLYAWTYNMYATDAFAFLDTFDVMKKNYQYLYNRGFKFLFDQLSGFNENGNPAWERAKNYVMSRLMWDVDADVDALLDAFFANYYEDAGTIMQTIMKENATYIKNNVLTKLKVEPPTADNYTEVQGNIFVPILDNYGKYFTKEYLEGALSQIQNAYAAIETYKYSEPEHYETLRNRILLESLPFQYIVSRYVYDGSYSSKVQKQYRWQLRADMEKLGVNSVKERWRKNELWNEIWGMPEYNQVNISLAEVTANGQIYLKADIVEGTDKGKCISDVYGDWMNTGSGELQFTQNGLDITETVNWNLLLADANHGEASIYVECPTAYIKDNMNSISGFTIKAGTTLVIGDLTPIYIVNDVHIGKQNGNWCECNEVELTYTQTIGKKLYFHGAIIAGPNKGAKISDVYGDWANVAEGTISYVQSGELCKAQVAQWCLYADNPNDYNSNILLQNNTVINSYEEITALSIEKGTVLTMTSDSGLVPIKIANSVSLQKDSNGDWGTDYNTVELFYAGTDGRGIYLDAVIVDGPDEGKTVYEAYGDWKIAPMGDMTYSTGGESVTGKVIWSPNIYKGAGNFYLSGDFSQNLSGINKIEIVQGTKIIPVDSTYNLTPIMVGNAVTLYQNEDGSYRTNSDMLQVKVQDNSYVTETGTENYDLRLIGSVDHLNYKRVGFVLSNTNINPTIEGREDTVFSTTNVYKTIKDGQLNREWTVADLYGLQAAYMFTMSLEQIPANTRIYVRSFKEQMNGKIVYGGIRMVTVPEEK